MTQLLMRRAQSVTYNIGFNLVQSILLNAVSGDKSELIIEDKDLILVQARIIFSFKQ